MLNQTFKAARSFCRAFSDEIIRTDLSIFYTYFRPPYGGGNQFLLALWNEFRRRKLRVENNIMSASARGCLFNSHHVDADLMACLRRKTCRMVHRVDGPLALHRDGGDAIDARIREINDRIADATVFQSEYSLRKQEELGLVFRSPCVIMNAADGAIFHRPAMRQFDPSRPLRSSQDSYPAFRESVQRSGASPIHGGRKIRLIASSWSVNVNKGADTLLWMDRNLDWQKYEFTFAGPVPVRLESIRVVPPMPSRRLADLLRKHDIYIAANRHDACSNSLIEALSCGLPALFHRSGGHPEIVGEAGFGYDDEGEISGLLEKLVEEYDMRRARISIPSISDVAEKYLRVLGLTV